MVPDSKDHSRTVRSMARVKRPMLTAPNSLATGSTVKSTVTEKLFIMITVMIYGTRVSGT